MDLSLDEFALPICIWGVISASDSAPSVTKSTGLRLQTPASTNNIGLQRFDFSKKKAARWLSLAAFKQGNGGGVPPEGKRSGNSDPRS
jgi:hypothetical protein